MNRSYTHNQIKIDRSVIWLPSFHFNVVIVVSWIELSRNINNDCEKRFIEWHYWIHRIWCYFSYILAPSYLVILQIIHEWLFYKIVYRGYFFHFRLQKGHRNSNGKLGGYSKKINIFENITKRMIVVLGSLLYFYSVRCENKKSAKKVMTKIQN